MASYPESWAMVEAEENKLLYHGSALPSLTELQPLSQLHNSDQKAVYLSSCIPYVLLYIWDAEKTQSSQKWVTGWLKDGVAYYEEQFPGQLKAFYEGVHGYVYSVLRGDEIQSVPQREDLFYSNTPLNVHCVTEIPDVYQELLLYEREGLFHVFRFEDAAAEKQEELIDRIATYIAKDKLIEQDGEQSHFMQRYFVQAWEKAKAK